MPKLLALDLDGTTFSEGTTLSENNRAYLEKAKTQGTVICFVSGRRRLEGLEHLFDLADYFVLNNGASAIAMPAQEVLYAPQIARADMLRLMELCDMHGAILHMFHDEGSYWGVNRITEEVVRLAAEFGKTARLYTCAADLPFETTDSFGISGNYLAVKESAEREGLNLFCAVSGPTLMDVVAGGYDKWKGTLFIARREGIDRADVVAAGNYFNDIEMIAGAGVGVAVRNAPGEVQAHADYVTERTHCEDAVAEIIERFIFI